MRIGRMESEKVAVEYVKDRLKEVKEILDDIAHNTGLVYICLNGRVVEMFADLGAVMSESLISTMKIIPDRIEMANEATEVQERDDAKDSELKGKKYYLRKRSADFTLATDKTILFSESESLDVILDTAMSDIFHEVGNGDGENGGAGSLWRCAREIYDSLRRGAKYTYADITWWIESIPIESDKDKEGK